jgi:hypothetical protein
VTTRRPRLIVLISSLALGALATAPPVIAQDDRLQKVLIQSGQGVQESDVTRQELRTILQVYPPSLGRVLKLDPTLMTSDAYLAPYPLLADFLKRRPEVARNPNYFLSFINQWGNVEDPVPVAEQTRRDALNLWRNTFDSLVFFGVFLIVTYTLTWLVRYVIGHRRWLRATKVQAEVHGRLLERLSSNDELLAYVQSPAGSHFLKASPTPEAPPSPSMGTFGMTSPFGRILWSVQAGLVLVSGGVGLLIIRRYVMEEVGDGLLTFGVLAVALGIGFALASTASYVISRRLGLIEPRTAPPSQTSA